MRHSLVDKLLACMLSAALVVSMCPVTALAEEVAANTDPSVVEIETMDDEGAVDGEAVPEGAGEPTEVTVEETDEAAETEESEEDDSSESDAAVVDESQDQLEVVSEGDMAAEDDVAQEQREEDSTDSEEEPDLQPASESLSIELNTPVSDRVNYYDDDIYYFSLERPTLVRLTLTWEDHSDYYGSIDILLWNFDDEYTNLDTSLITDVSDCSYTMSKKLSAGLHTVTVSGFGAVEYTLLLEDCNTYASTISAPDVSLGVKAWVFPSITTTPAKVDGTKYTYTSADESVAAALPGGRIVGKGAGQTQVIITDTLGGASTTINVTVRDDVAITGRVGSETIKVPLFGSKKLSYKSTSPNPFLRWKTSNSKVAIVTDYGEVFAYKAGKATISATDSFGHTVKWKVTVPKIKAKRVKVATIKKQTYSGKAKKPAPVITYAGNKLKKGRDYKLSYTKNRNVGTAKVTIKFKGSYTGKTTKKFKIAAPKVGKPTITYWYHGSYWSRIEFDSGSNATGTQLRIVGGGPTYDKHIKGGGGEGWCKKGYANARVTFKIRSYKKIGKKYFYSKWVTKVL